MHTLCANGIQLLIILALLPAADNEQFTSRAAGSCLYQCLGTTQEKYRYSCILNLSTWGCVVKFIVGPLYSQGRGLCTHQKEG